MEVRVARPGDGEGIARCHLDSAATYSAGAPSLFQMPDSDGYVEWIEDDLARERSADELDIVAVVDGEIAGHVEARILEPIDSARWQQAIEHGERRVFVNALAVASRWRRHGAGRALMEAIESWARERGATRVQLDTWIDSPLSVPFYESLGYARRAIRFEKRLL